MVLRRPSNSDSGDGMKKVVVASWKCRRGESGLRVAESRIVVE